MRKKIIGTNLSFAKQKKLAEAMGVVPSDILRRMLFNFLEHVRSGKENNYPDAQGPDLFARTSTIFIEPRTPNGIYEQGVTREWPLGCGGCGSDTSFYSLCCYDRSDVAIPQVGLAVTLPP